MSGIQSPLTGRHWNGASELLEHIDLYGRSIAAGSFMGSLRNVSGEFGVKIGKKLTERFDTISFEASKLFNPIVSDAIMLAIDSGEEDIAQSGRALSIIERRAAQISTQPTKLTQAAAASVPSEMSMAKRTLSGILEAGETAAQVMRFRV